MKKTVMTGSVVDEWMMVALEKIVRICCECVQKSQSERECECVIWLESKARDCGEI